MEKKKEFLQYLSKRRMLLRLLLKNILFSESIMSHKLYSLLLKRLFKSRIGVTLPSPNIFILKILVLNWKESFQEFSLVLKVTLMLKMHLGIFNLNFHSKLGDCIIEIKWEIFQLQKPLEMNQQEQSIWFQDFLF
jgi:hypothetical protein